MVSTIHLDCIDANKTVRMKIHPRPRIAKEKVAELSLNKNPSYTSERKDIRYKHIVTQST